MPQSYLPKPRMVTPDPNAATSAFGRVRASKRYTSPEDDFLSSLIPEEDVYEAQQTLGERGAETGSPYYIPSRDTLKQSGMAKLKQLLAVKQAEAAGAALPRRVEGEYGLEEARIKGAADVEVAKQRADAQAEQQAMSDRRIRELFAMGESGRNVRAEGAEAGRTQRAEGLDTGRAQRQQLGLAYQQAAAMERAPDERPWYQWMFGRGQTPRDKAEALRKQAQEQFAAGGLADQDHADLPTIVQEYNTKYRGYSPNQLRQALQNEFEFDQPGEIEDILRAIMSARGVR